MIVLKKHFFFFKNWRISLQCCIGFCCTMWVSCKFTPLSSLLSSLSLSPSHSSRSSQSTRLRLCVLHSSLPLAILTHDVYTFQCHSQFVPLSPSLVPYSHCAVHSLDLFIWLQVCILWHLHSFCSLRSPPASGSICSLYLWIQFILDSTYKWVYIVYLSLTSFT